MSLESESVAYHSRKPAGKLEVVATKPCLTQHDLALAYTPGVAKPCLLVQEKPEDVFKYTAKGNLVAVITNGSAVLGLGDIGPLAGKPVMEGKAILFKRFADIDVFDLELDTHDPQAFISAVRLLEPTFGGINLEDIKAPECFEIEAQLRKQMKIPVFHDDQHGTAIITAAGMLNALELAGKQMDQVRLVFSGAGAATIAVARFLIKLGAKREHIIICDSQGVIYRGRPKHMNPYKEEFAAATEARSLAEALVGADVFLGFSTANLVSQEMVRSMAARPIIFALANPVPEIGYQEAKEANPEVIVATGRSDDPNQVNNVLGFPSIFRGALDVRASEINDEMKIAAARALAALTQEDVPDAVQAAYGTAALHFGPDYFIPKALDPRVLLWVAPAVAQAAMDSGVAGRQLDMDQYREELEAKFGKAREMMRIIIRQAKSAPRRIVFSEGTHPKIIRAACQLAREGIAKPLLLGPEAQIRQQAQELQLKLDGSIEINDPEKSERLERYAQRLYELRCRKGVTLTEARELIRQSAYFAAIMVEQGDAEGMISGLSFHYPEALRPPLQIIKTKVSRHMPSSIAAGVYMVTLKNKVLFFADATVNIEPSAEELAEIALLTSELAQTFHVEPRIAMLSFSNFGSVRHPKAQRVRRAVQIVKEHAPELVIDGEMQADTALVPEILNRTYPFNQLQGEANVLIFPNLESGNIAYKILQRLGKAEVVGPILVGMRRPVHILQRGDEVKDIVNLAAIAVVEAQGIRP
ncbi:MAG TPA: NADP-dependent malic enzyme [Candidatus Fraserbacteria bacterium]|nr:NADP-dependent malic enzyme [Candidatus Fraserbacteria bacterium]